MNKNTMQAAYGSVEEYEKNCYLFAPSISKREKVGKPTYYVRRYSAAARISKRRWKHLPYSVPQQI